MSSFLLLYPCRGSHRGGGTGRIVWIAASEVKRGSVESSVETRRHELLDGVEAPPQWSIVQAKNVNRGAAHFQPSLCVLNDTRERGRYRILDDGTRGPRDTGFDPIACH
jgi:hypothetical protein